MSETQELFAYKTTVTGIAMQIEAAEQEVDEAKAVLKEKREALKKLNAELLKAARAEEQGKMIDFGEDDELPELSYGARPIRAIPGLTESIYQKLEEKFVILAEVVQWVGNEHAESVPGIGPAAKAKIGEAINKMCGYTDEEIHKVAEAEKAKRLESEDVQTTQTNPMIVAQLSNVLEELIDKAQEVGDDSITELEQLQTVIDRKQCFTSEQKRRVYAIKDRLDAIEL